MSAQLTSEFSTVDDKIEIAEGKKAAGDKAFREGQWQPGMPKLSLRRNARLTFSPPKLSDHTMRLIRAISILWQHTEHT